MKNANRILNFDIDSCSLVYFNISASAEYFVPAGKIRVTPPVTVLPGLFTKSQTCRFEEGTKDGKGKNTQKNKRWIKKKKKVFHIMRQKMAILFWMPFFGWLIFS
jgi:hypothetical protein